MNTNLQKEIDTIVKAIADTGLVTKIILFGSLARGEETSGSDIDLCALTHIADRRPLDITVELRRKLYDIQTMPLDILTYNQDQFAEHAGRATSFEHHIEQEGVVIYESTG